MAKWCGNWKGIEQSRDIIKKAACYVVVTDNNNRVWEEPWLPGVVGFKTIPKEQDIAQVSWLVSNLKSESGDGWDEQKLTRMLDD